MLYEYAIDPQALGSSWQNFRYIIEKFGFDKGRLISQFPKQWFREVYAATDGMPPMQKKRIEEALNQAKKNKVARFNRPYDSSMACWLDAALREHDREPFHAIIANENPGGDSEVCFAEDLDENDELMAVPHDCAVKRDIESITAALRSFLRLGSRIVFVDPFFDPYCDRQRLLFLECFTIVKDLNPKAACEIHYRFHRNKPSNEELERDATRLFKEIIPDGICLTVYCWKERVGGEDFHARYLLTERGGLRVDAGFDPVGDHQNTDIALMDYELCQRRLASFERHAVDYDLVEPVLSISSTGAVEHV